MNKQNNLLLVQDKGFNLNNCLLKIIRTEDKNYEISFLHDNLVINYIKFDSFNSEETSVQINDQSGTKICKVYLKNIGEVDYSLAENTVIYQIVLVKKEEEDCNVVS